MPPAKALISVQTMMKHTGPRRNFIEHSRFKVSIESPKLLIGQIFLPQLRNCPMEFIRDILCGKKKYFLRREIISIKVPTCPELTVKIVKVLWSSSLDPVCFIIVCTEIIALAGGTYT